MPSWREPAAAAPPPPPSKTVEVHCRDCGRLLLRASPACGRIEIVCPDRRCKRYQVHHLRTKIA